MCAYVRRHRRGCVPEQPCPLDLHPSPRRGTDLAWGVKVEIACVGNKIGGAVDIRGAIAQCIADNATVEETPFQESTPSPTPAEETAVKEPAPTPASPATQATLFDSIPDSTYFGSLTNFEFRDRITVVDSGAALVKQGDTVEWEWSVQWERGLRDCAHQNRDSWGGSEIRLATEALLQINGIHCFEVHLVSSCPEASGDIPSSFDRPMTLTLQGNQLIGTVGIAQVAFDLDGPD